MSPPIVPGSISIIIPTRNGGAVFQETLRAVIRQRIQISFEVIIIDSESADGTADFAENIFADQSTNPHNIPLRLRRISVKEFGHGRTRNVAAEMAHGEILVFLSQDATPIGTDWLASVAKPFSQNAIAGMYCRQIPRQGTSLPERYNLDSAFPSQGRILTRESLGSVSVLFSNAASAMRREIWHQFHFDERLMMCEDQYWAVGVLQAGHSIAYSAEACVAHSHNYEWRTLVIRYFDSGVALPVELRGVGQRNHLRYLLRELGFTLRFGGLGALPWLFTYEVGRFVGFTLGVNHTRLPIKLSRHLSAYPDWFESAGPTRLRRKQVLDRSHKDTNRRVCFLVCNSSRSGARVRKEARALAQRQAVTVLAMPDGISDASDPGNSMPQMVLGQTVELAKTTQHFYLDGYHVFIVPRPRHRIGRGPRVTTSDRTGEATVHFPLLTTIWDLIRQNAQLSVQAYHQHARVYHAHDLDVLLAGVIAARLNGAKLIYDSHELWPMMSESRVRKYAWIALERLLLRFVDSVITINDSIAFEMKRLYGVQCTVLHNYPDVRPMAPGQEDNGDSVLPKFGPLVVRFHGVFAQDRGLETLIRSVPLLDPSVRLVLQGYGPLEAELRHIITALGVDNRVTILGPVPNAKLIDEARLAHIGIITIVPSNLNHRLCSPNKLYEYLQAGLALIVNDLPELGAAVRNTGAGVVCNAEDATSIADAINYFAIDRNKLSKARSSARHAATLYVWENEVPRLLELYDSILQPQEA